MELYGWTTISEEPLNPKLTRKVIHAKSMTIARMELQKSAVVPEHSHMNEQISIVEKGALKFLLEGVEQIVRAGEILTIPPHARHSVEALEDSRALDIFSPVREDWIKGADQYLRG